MPGTLPGDSPTVLPFTSRSDDSNPGMRRVATVESSCRAAAAGRLDERTSSHPETARLESQLLSMNR